MQAYSCVKSTLLRHHLPRKCETYSVYMSHSVIQQALIFLNQAPAAPLRPQAAPLPRPDPPGPGLRRQLRVQVRR